MSRPFSTYNVKAHNRVLGQIRTDNAARRNAAVLDILRAAELPAGNTDRVALYVAAQTHSGKLPWSVLLKLVRQVRAERSVNQ